MATLTVPFPTDFSADLLTDIGRIKFINFTPATASFAAEQFDGPAIRDDVRLIGSVGENHVEVTGDSLDASAWRFIGWQQAYDTISLKGAALDDVIVGSRKADTIGGRNGADELWGMAGADTVKGGYGRDIIFGGPGADTLIGGRQRDEFHYADGTEIKAGESIDGGDSGSDRIVLDGIDLDYDFEPASIVNVEELRYTNGGTATFDGSQIGGLAALLAITGSAGRDHVIVNGDTVDLSNVTLSDWASNGLDDIVIKGTTGHDEIIGSSGRDTVWATFDGDTISTGGGQDNVLLGGGGSTVDLGQDDDRVSIGLALFLEPGDVINGGVGFDTVSITQGSSSVDLDFTGVTLLGFEGLQLNDNIGYDSAITAHFTGDQLNSVGFAEVDIRSDHTTIMVDG